MKKREELIKQYFQMWLMKKNHNIEIIFDENIIYLECYGPVYQGLEQLKRWFKEWNEHGTVLEWNIKQFIHEGKSTVVEWYFRCNYGGTVDGFDGITVVEFNEIDKIVLLKEFQSKSEHYYPYEN